MIRYFAGFPRARVALLVILAVGIWPATADAGIIVFRNDTDNPVMIQGISIINRVVRKGNLHVLRPGEVSRELILVPGAILFTVADAKQPTRILCQETIQVLGIDLFYTIKADVPDKPKDGEAASKVGTGKTTSAKLNSAKVKLVPWKPTPAVTSPPATPRR
jgi:hypothetical protein